MIGCRTFRVWTSAVCLLLAVAPDALASWTKNAPLGLPVCVAPGDQHESMVIADGGGGAIVVWQDGRAGDDDVYAQHVLASGQLDPAWPVEGLAVCTAPGDQSALVVVGDGAGGAIVCWRDSRNGTAYDIYAQHLLGSGTVDPAWPRDGRAVCTASGNQHGPVLVADGRGGAIVAWQDARGDVGFDIYAQHLLASGATDPAWPVNGHGFCAASGRQSGAALAADGAGGAIVAWLDLRAGRHDLYAQHLTASGVDRAWPADGGALRTSGGEASAPAIVTDGVGGALVGWTAARGSRHVVHVRRVLASGPVDSLWSVEGRALGAGADPRTPSMVSDGMGGAIVVWSDSRNGGRGIYAQHVLASGAVDPAWPVEGRPLCPPDGEHRDPRSIADGAGGVIVVWSGWLRDARDIYAQHVNLADVVGKPGPVAAAPLATDRGTTPHVAAIPDVGAKAGEETPGEGNKPDDGTPAEDAKRNEKPATAEATISAQDAAAGTPNEPVGNEPRPGLRVSLVSGTVLQDLQIDGKLAESAWSAADSIANLVTIEPQEGGVPAGRTVVKVLADAAEVVIGVKCVDPDPSGIVSFSKARDSELDEEDNVLVVIDTFGDGRSGYAFAINPGGSRFDGLVNAQGDDVNSDWDAVWEGAASLDSTGWSAEIRIPIKSLGFRKGLKQWGFNVERHVQRLQETSRWSGAKRDYQIWQMSRAGLLLGLPDFDLGRGLSVQPASVSNVRRTAPRASRDAASRVSLDVRQKLGADLSAAVTLNTDFGEAEADVRQTNLSRFDILYPERRAFFLEGSDIFEFGSGLSVEDAELRPFFSRRIGFVVPEGEDEAAGREVPIRAGGKLLGSIGQARVGTLVVATDPLAELRVPRSGMAVVRLRRNVLKESSAGLIATFGGPLSQGGWTEGADFTFKTSEFSGDRNLLAGFWGLVTHQLELEGDRNAYGGTLAYPNDPFSFDLTLMNVGDGFQPQLGFVQRTGGILQTSAEYKPRPDWPLVRQTLYGLSYFRALQKSGRWESEVLKAKPFDWLLKSGDRLTVRIESQGEQPEEAFEVFESPARRVSIPAGTYRWNRCEMAANLAPKRRVSGEVSYAFGGFYKGRLRTLAADVTLQPVSMLTLQFGGEKNIATLPQGDFTQYLESLRTEFKPSPLFQVTNFVQYDNESRSLGSASRLRWSFHPLGDLYLTYNHNLLRPVATPKWDFVSYKVSMKIQYAMRY